MVLPALRFYGTSVWLAPLAQLTMRHCEFMTQSVYNLFTNKQSRVRLISVVRVMSSRLMRVGRLFLAALAMSWSLFKASAQPGDTNPLDNLVSADTGFGFRLLQQLSHDQPGANIFISPYSIATVLQVLQNGARGVTADEIRQALGTGTLGVEDMNVAAQSLAQKLAACQTNVALNIANALWYRQGVELTDNFKNANAFYRATLSALDFRNPRSAQVMNEWASENTSGRIKTIIQPPIPRDTAMVIANAIYFKGTWLNQFDAKQTRSRPFHLLSGGEEPVAMMQQTRSFSYQEANGFQAVQLPYAGRQLQMQVFLPGTNSSVEALLGQIMAGSWREQILAGFRERRGTVVLPRFTMRYGAELRRALAGLGIQSALSLQADFSGMSASHLYVSEVKHQSFVEVNEEGTEAAAVTTGVMALASFQQQPPPFDMVVDRPFVFMISEQQTRCILFMGMVFKPGPSGGTSNR
jgi:serine protease inhibitor